VSAREGNKFQVENWGMDGAIVLHILRYKKRVEIVRRYFASR